MESVPLHTLGSVPLHTLGSVPLSGDQRRRNAARSSASALSDIRVPFSSKWTRRADLTAASAAPPPRTKKVATSAHHRNASPTHARCPTSSAASAYISSPPPDTAPLHRVSVDDGSGGESPVGGTATVARSVRWCDTMVFLLHCARAACCSARATACDASMVLATMSSYAVVQSARRAEVSERTSRLNLAGALSARFRFSRGVPALPSGPSPAPPSTPRFRRRLASTSPSTPPSLASLARVAASTAIARSVSSASVMPSEGDERLVAATSAGERVDVDAAPPLLSPTRPSATSRARSPAECSYARRS